MTLAFTPKALPVGPLSPAAGFNTTMLDAPWRPYTRGDMPTSDRNRIVDDGGHVWESELRGADRAGYSPATCRNEAWLDTAQGGGYAAGATVFVGFGLWLSPSYPAPPGWSTCGFQLHTPTNYPAGYGSPMVTIESSGGTLKLQNNALGRVADTWAYERGRWHYLLIEILIAQAGRVRLWRSLDVLPDHTKPPLVDYAMPTLPPSPGSDGQPLQKSYTKYGQYRRTGDSNTNVIRLDAPTEAASMAELVASLRGRCRPAALGAATPPPPPPPPPPAGFEVRYVSETDTTVTYEWTPPQGQQVVRLTRPDGVQTIVWSQSKSSHTFKKKLPGVYLVDVLGLLASDGADYPAGGV